MKRYPLYALFTLLMANGCSTKEAVQEEIRVRTPVEVTTVQSDSFILAKTFKGVTHYLASGDIRSPITGYLTKIYVRRGDAIRKNAPLFGLETKEAYVLKGKNYLNDPTLKNIGQTLIRAPENGLVTAVLGEENEYVQEGTLLGNYSAPDMFVFLIEVPAEQDSSVKVGKPCTITLPNGKHIQGKIANTLAMADSASQTESYVVVANHPIVLPAGLQLNVTFIDEAKAHAQALPKEAVLSNEIQTEFWVMKLLNDSTAIKTPVTLGWQNEKAVEILKPIFPPTDRIVTKGNYGLSDTAYVQLKTVRHGK